MRNPRAPSSFLDALNHFLSVNLTCGIPTGCRALAVNWLEVDGPSMAPEAQASDSTPDVLGAMRPPPLEAVVARVV